MAKLKRNSQSDITKAQQECERIKQLMRVKDSEVWDLEKEIEKKTQIVAELTDAQNKKSKNKKQIDCVNCLKKDADLTGLREKVEK